MEVGCVQAESRVRLNSFIETTLSGKPASTSHGSKVERLLWERPDDCFGRITVIGFGSAKSCTQS